MYLFSGYNIIRSQNILTFLCVLCTSLVIYRRNLSHIYITLHDELDVLLPFGSFLKVFDENKFLDEISCCYGDEC
jgi:hypothetical protein